MMGQMRELKKSQMKNSSVSIPKKYESLKGVMEAISVNTPALAALVDDAQDGEGFVEAQPASPASAVTLSSSCSTPERLRCRSSAEVSWDELEARLFGTPVAVAPAASAPAAEITPGKTTAPNKRGLPAARTPPRKAGRASPDELEALAADDFGRPLTPAECTAQFKKRAVGG